MSGVGEKQMGMEIEGRLTQCEDRILNIENQMEKFQTEIKFNMAKTDLKMSEFHGELMSINNSILSNNQELRREMDSAMIKASLKQEEMLEKMSNKYDEMINRFEKNQLEINDRLLDTMLKQIDSYTKVEVKSMASNTDTKNKIKLLNKKEFWAIVSSAITALLVYLGVK